MGGAAGHMLALWIIHSGEVCLGPGVIVELIPILAGALLNMTNAVDSNLIVIIAKWQITWNRAKCGRGSIGGVYQAVGSWAWACLPGSWFRIRNGRH